MLRDKIIKELKNQEQKGDVPMNNQKMQNWTIIDWKDGEEEILKHGVSVYHIFSTKEWILDLQDHCIIRNFPSIKVKNAHLHDCIFENCNQVILEEGTATQCVFISIKTLWLDNIKVYDSDFRDLYCNEGNNIISLKNSRISGCRFHNIHLENDVHLGNGVGDCIIEKCIFENTSTTREDRELFTCEKTIGKFIRRKQKYNMVNRASCSGLEHITDESGAINIGSFDI